MENNIKLEKMRYRNNSNSYSLGLLGILFSISAAFVLMNSAAATNLVIFLKIIMNILILLFGFLACEKAKTYSKNQSYVLCALGVVNIVRIFWYPLRIINGYALFMNNYKIDEVTGRKVSIAEGDIETKITKALSPVVRGVSEGILPQSGYIRATIAIILLALAAACFIVSGLIGIKKSNTLTNYLRSIDALK